VSSPAGRQAGQLSALPPTAEASDSDASSSEAGDGADESGEASSSRDRSASASYDTSSVSSPAGRQTGQLSALPPTAEASNSDASSSSEAGGDDASGESAKAEAVPPAATKKATGSEADDDYGDEDLAEEAAPATDATATAAAASGDERSGDEGAAAEAEEGGREAPADEADGEDESGDGNFGVEEDEERKDAPPPARSSEGSSSSEAMPVSKARCSRVSFSEPPGLGEALENMPRASLRGPGDSTPFNRPSGGDEGVEMSPMLSMRSSLTPSDAGDGADEHSPPQEAAGPSLTVTVVGAGGLRHADGGGTEKSDPYCVVQVEGKPGLRFETGTVDDADDLVWNFSWELRGCHQGDNLVFSVYDRDPGGDRDELLGRAVLKAERLLECKDGGRLSTELELTDTGSPEPAMLGVKVDVPAGGLPAAPPRPEPQQTTPERASRLSVVQFVGEAQVASEFVSKRRPSGMSTPFNRRVNDAGTPSSRGKSPHSTRSATDRSPQSTRSDTEAGMMAEESEVADLGLGAEEGAVLTGLAAAKVKASLTLSTGTRSKSVSFSGPVDDREGDGEGGEFFPRRSTIRKSCDSTPRFVKTAEFPDPDEAEDAAEEEEEKEEEQTAEEVEAHVVVEDVLDVPDVPAVASNAAASPSAASASARSPAAASSEDEMLLLHSGAALQGSDGSRGGKLPPLAASRASSEPFLHRTTAQKARRRGSARAPSTPRSKFNRKAQSWDTRFHLVDETNDLKPRELRHYFSRPEPRPRDSRTELVEVAVGDRRSLPKASPLTADSAPAVIPTRHRIGGQMRNQGGNVVPWNDRWHAGVHLYNEGMHPLHRATFSRPSVFEESKTQVWRRAQDLQISPGVWHKPSREELRFPPLGV